MPDPLDAHYTAVVRQIMAGRVVPFLGAGANLCNRPPGIGWEPNQCRHLPGGTELAAYLAEHFGYPSSKARARCPTCHLEIGVPEKARDLAHVSQYVAVRNGLGPLYDELHRLFDAEYPATPVHRFFATLPIVLRDRGYPRTDDSLRRQLLIVTTNYDDLMERAFNKKGVPVEDASLHRPFHLVSYVAEGEQRGKFLHRSPGGAVQVIEKPNEYRGLLLDQCPIILKLHGTVDRDNAERDSFAITEDSYIEYLTHTDIASLIPVPLPAKLKNSNLLFLGYGLRDWNLRVILHRIWGEQRLSWKSWAVQCHSDSIEKEFWRQRGVDILNVRLVDYVAALSERLQALLHAGGAS